jgi:hypothetical protein
MTQAFNLSQLANFVNTSGQLNAATGLTNQVPVANGGTGRSTVTAGALLIGAGTSAMTEITGTTAGTIVVASPTGWTAQPAGSVTGGDYIATKFVSPSPWTKPALAKAIRVTVMGGGGNGGPVPATPIGGASSGGGGGGGAAVSYFDAPAIPGSALTITAGAGTNSFDVFLSVTGGGNATVTSAPTTPGAGGAASTGTGNLFSFSGTPGTNGSLLTSGAGGNAAFYGWFGAASATRPAPATGGVNGNPAPGQHGAGGSGAIKTSPSPGAFTGGTGAPGFVLIEEFY